jgi:formate/nitrite transporter FocA (FNT family)
VTAIPDVCVQAAAALDSIAADTEDPTSAAALRAQAAGLLAGLAGVVGLLAYGTLAARVDGRFAWLASAFTVPMALIPRRK